jgi:hypothetical protein
VQLVKTEAGLIARAVTVAPTSERLAHGDVRTATLWDETGKPVIIQRSLNLVEQLALAGELGDDVARLVAAADWFIERAERAQLRGRMVRSQIARISVLEPLDEMTRARSDLAHAYDAIGADCWGAAYDALVWDIEPRGPDRRALTGSPPALARWVRIGWGVSTGSRIFVRWLAPPKNPRDPVVDLGGFDVRCWDCLSDRAAPRNGRPPRTGC